MRRRGKLFLPWERNPLTAYATGASITPRPNNREEAPSESVPKRLLIGRPANSARSFDALTATAAIDRRLAGQVFVQLVLSLVDERGRPQDGFLRAHEVLGNLSASRGVVLMRWRLERRSIRKSLKE
jgi:hypothetical protein